MPPAKITQTDFSAGMYRVSSGQIPDNGFYDAVNLLVDADGQLYCRGGSTYFSNAAFGSKLTWMWSGVLGGLDVVLISNGANTAAVSNTGVVTLLGAPAVANRPVVINAVLYAPGPLVYAGSQKTAYTYTTGTVAVTQGDTAVTGTGTAWTGVVDSGSMIRFAGAGPWYSINNASGTSMFLNEPYLGSTIAGAAYEITNYSTTGVGVIGFYHGTIGNRLVVASGDRVYFSAVNDPSSFQPDDYHQIPDGVTIKGLQRYGDLMMVFTDQGVWAIENLALDLTDSFGNPQQTLRKLNANLVLWGERGIVDYENAVVVPTQDNVYMMDSVSSPAAIGTSITPLLKSYAAAGYIPGMATVFQHHYILPIIQTNGTPVDCLICRLDQQHYPWTRLQGMAVQASAFGLQTNAGNIGWRPRLLAANGTSVARVIRLDSFQPDVTLGGDADASAVNWELTLRDMPTDGSSKALLKKARVRYEATGVTVSGSVDYGNSYTALTATSGGSADATGTNPGVWTGNLRGRHMRLKLNGTGATKAVVRSVELLVRPSGRQ